MTPRMFFRIAQSQEEKGLSSTPWLAKAVGLVLGTGADDIGALESGNWTAGQDRTRRVER